jgi:hypothetical protein
LTGRTPGGAWPRHCDQRSGRLPVAPLWPA